jgi:hypothetical protein
MPSTEREQCCDIILKSVSAAFIYCMFNVAVNYVSNWIFKRLSFLLFSSLLPFRLKVSKLITCLIMSIYLNKEVYVVAREVTVCCTLKV